VVLAADSSSASANTLTIQKTEWASVGILKVCPAEGPSFFVREEYLPFAAETLEPGRVLTPEEADSLLSSGRVYLAEREAMAYLARSEHSRFMLVAKLVKKGFTAADYAPALDYLEAKGYLDDSRFAEAWLRSRSIHTHEGRIKLLAGLQSRGVFSDVARNAVDEYYRDHDESEACRAMAAKLLNQGRTTEKTMASLVRRGFSLRLIRSIIGKS
jgi:regulatory protein